MWGVSLAASGDARNDLGRRTTRAERPMTQPDAEEKMLRAITRHQHDVGAYALRSIAAALNAAALVMAGVFAMLWLVADDVHWSLVGAIAGALAAGGLLLSSARGVPRLYE